MSAAPTRTADFLAFFAAATVPVVWLLQTWVGENNAFTTLLLYLPQHGFGLLPSLFLFRSLWRKSWAATACNGAALAFFAVYLMGVELTVGGTSQPIAARSSIRLVTFNIQMGWGGIPQLESEIKSLQADVICLQETTSSRRSLPDLTPDLLARFPGWYSSRVQEVTTLSRFPIAETKVHPMPAPSGRAMLENTLTTPQGQLTVFNAHISTAHTAAWNEGHQPLPARVWTLLPHIGKTARAREQQLPVIEKALLAAPTPWVLLGDFNNPPRGHFYAFLSRLGTDAFPVAGKGTGFSFPSGFPVMRIDYCWLGPGVTALKCEALPVSASDHRPVVTDILLPTLSDSS